MPLEHGAISVRASRFVVGRLEAGMAGGTLQEFSELLGGIAQVDEPADKFFVYAVRMFFLRYAEGRDRLSNVSITSLSTLRYHHHHHVSHQQLSSSHLSIITVVVLPGSYYDAARWGRILGEVYCHVLLGLFGDEGAAEWPSLGVLAYALPEWVWQHAAYEHVAAYSAGHVQEKY